MDFLTMIVMCFLFMFEDGTTTCTCRAVPPQQTQSAHLETTSSLKKPVPRTRRRGPVQ
jgi:hypothetical protein